MKFTSGQRVRIKGTDLDGLTGRVSKLHGGGVSIRLDNGRFVLMAIDNVEEQK